MLKNYLSSIFDKSEILKEIVLLFGAFCSFLLIIFGFDLTYRVTYLIPSFPLKEIILNVAGTIIGIYIISLILAITLRMFLFVFDLRFLKKFKNAFYLFINVVMFIFLFIVFSTTTFRGFGLVNIIDHHIYQRVSIAIMFAILVVLIFKFRESFSRFFFKISFSKRVLSIILLCCLLLIGYAGIDNLWRKQAKQGGVDSKKLSKPNIILITVDELDFNHTSLGNYQFQTTPNLKNFAKVSYNFINARCYKSSTFIALTSILSSKYYRKINHIRESKVLFSGKNKNERLSALLKPFGYDFFVLLPPGLQKRVFSSLLRPFNKFYIIPATPISPLNFARIYDLYFYKMFGLVTYLEDFLVDYTLERANTLLETMSINTLTEMEKINELAPDLIAEQRNHFFLWMHFFSPHEYYRSSPPLPFRGRFPQKDKKISNYDESILYTDYGLGNFLDHLKLKGYFNNSIIIITADHGLRDGDGPEPGSSIPLLIHIPNQTKGRTISAPVELVDIAPTILGLLAIPIPNWMEGKSLVRYFHKRF